MSKTIQELPQNISDSKPIFKIFLNNILENYHSIRRFAGGSPSAAVIKANAYGLGIEQVGAALYHDAGCSDFFVATPQEAFTLRNRVKKATIYVLNGLISGQINFYKDYNIRPVLCDLEQIELWQQHSTLPCAVHFDTGINRLGLNKKETDYFINQGAKKLNIQHIMSHLACADQTSNPINRQQLGKFQKISNHFSGIEASFANTSGILMGSEYHFDLLRPGLMLFGGNSSLKEKLPDAIKSSCEILGKIIQIKELERGSVLGYNSRWCAPKKSRIAYVNLGYADGFPIEMTGKAFCFISGEKREIIGQISMDMLAVDITGLANITVGDEVELLGKNITIEFMAETSNLSQYEILTYARERYQRYYIK